MNVPGLLSLALAASLGWLGATTYHATPQDKKKPSGVEAAAGMQFPKAGKHHKLFAVEAGEWEYTNKAWFGPGEPMVSKGVSRSKLTKNGLWLVQEVTGTMMGQHFEGYSALTYNAKKKKYVSVWLDNFGDYLTLAEGGVSEDGKVRTLHAKMPGMDGTPVDTRWVNTQKSKDEMLFELFMKGPDGKDFRTMEITYTRKQ